MTKVPRPQTQKITELSIQIPGAVRIIEDARIMELTDTHVVLRYKKPRSVKRWEQLFPLSQVLYIRDKGLEAANDAEADGEEGQETATATAAPKKPKRICDAIVIDTFQLDEFADIASIDKLEGTKVFATTTEGDQIVADTSICRFVQDVAANAAGASIAATLNSGSADAAPARSTPARAARPARATANFEG